MGVKTLAKGNPELLRGTVELLLLKALSAGPQHGFGVARWLEEVTNDVLKIEEGSLYPALHRMESRGWLEAEWGISDKNRQVKYYRVTRRGRGRLRAESAGWAQFAAAVSKVLQTASEKLQWQRTTDVSGAEPTARPRPQLFRDHAG